MSQVPAPEPARPPYRSWLRGPARWTLRTRLLAALIALLAAVSIVIGLVSVLALNRFLTEQLDAQLNNAVNRSRIADGDDHPPEGQFGPGYGFPPGSAEGTLDAHLAGGQVQPGASTLTRTGSRAPLPPASAARLASVTVDGRAHTIDLGEDLGPYRLIAVHEAGDDVDVTGLPFAGVRTTVGALTVVVIAVTVLGLVAAAAVGAAIIRVSLLPMRRMAATARRVAQLPLEEGEVALAVRVPEEDTDPRTEVGQVGAALNRMLGHVANALSVRQASQMRMRRFVADASHELRTPLASIRGYAEITRRSGEELPPGVANSLRRVESEAVRMTGLVEDLLLLARLDEGRELASDPVDLSLVLVDVVSDAHAAGPDHVWVLELPEEPVTVLGDAARLHQVVANLLANARTHTPPGTNVRVSLERRPAGPAPAGAESEGSAGIEAVLRVVDDGPGIPPDLLPEVFERFARGDSSRSRAVGSTGLGLAIVASVVEAHGGHVEVSSVAGRTEITVRLPAAPAPDPAAEDTPAPRPAPARAADPAPGAAAEAVSPSISRPVGRALREDVGRST